MILKKTMSVPVIDAITVEPITVEDIRTYVLALDKKSHETLETHCKVVEEMGEVFESECPIIRIPLGSEIERRVLRGLSKNTSPKIKIQNVTELLKIAIKFEIPVLKKECEDYIINNFPKILNHLFPKQKTEEEVEEMYKMAVRYDFKKVELRIQEDTLRQKMGDSFIGQKELSKILGDNALEGVDVPRIPRAFLGALEEPSVATGEAYKTVAETHVLYLLPKTLNGSPFTLKRLVESNQSGWREFPQGQIENDRDQPCANEEVESTRWVLIPKKPLASTGNQTLEEQKQELSAFNLRNLIRNLIRDEDLSEVSIDRIMEKMTSDEVATVMEKYAEKADYQVANAIEEFCKLFFWKSPPAENLNTIAAYQIRAVDMRKLIDPTYQSPPRFARTGTPFQNSDVPETEVNFFLLGEGNKITISLVENTSRMSAIGLAVVRKIPK